MLLQQVPQGAPKSHSCSPSVTENIWAGRCHGDRWVTHPQPSAWTPALNATGSNRQQAGSTTPSPPGAGYNPSLLEAGVRLRPQEAQDKRGLRATGSEPDAPDAQAPQGHPPTHLGALLCLHPQGACPLCSRTLHWDASTAWPSACTRFLPRTQGRTCGQAQGWARGREASCAPTPFPGPPPYLAGLRWSRSSPCARHPHPGRELPPALAPLCGDAQHLFWAGTEPRALARPGGAARRPQKGAQAHGQVQTAARRGEGPAPPQPHFLPLGVGSPRAQPGQRSLNKPNLALPSLGSLPVSPAPRMALVCAGHGHPGRRSLAADGRGRAGRPNTQLTKPKGLRASWPAVPGAGRGGSGSQPQALLPPVGVPTSLRSRPVQAKESHRRALPPALGAHCALCSECPSWRPQVPPHPLARQVPRFWLPAGRPVPLCPLSVPKESHLGCCHSFSPPCRWAVPGCTPSSAQGSLTHSDIRLLGAEMVQRGERVAGRQWVPWAGAGGTG